MNTKILCGDAIKVLKTLPDNSINCCVTSPPYYNLRDYGTQKQIGLETNPEEYIEKLVKVFSEVRRVLTEDGTLWVNIADSYAGSFKGKGANPKGKQKTNKGSLVNQNLQANFSSEKVKPKDMIGIPWMLAFALRNDGWYLRSDIIWNKTNAMPSPVKDRPVSSYEHVFLFSKSKRYYFNQEPLLVPVAESTSNRMKYGYKSEKYLADSYGAKPQPICVPRPGKPSPSMRKGRDVWSFGKNCSRSNHFAAFPEKLAENCILSGCPDDGTVLDPFCGSGTTGVAALKNDRNCILIDINQEYCNMSEERITEFKKVS